MLALKLRESVTDMAYSTLTLFAIILLDKSSDLRERRAMYRFVHRPRHPLVLLREQTDDGRSSATVSVSQRGSRVVIPGIDAKLPAADFGLVNWNCILFIRTWIPWRRTGDDSGHNILLSEVTMTPDDGRDQRTTKAFRQCGFIEHLYRHPQLRYCADAETERHNPSDWRNVWSDNKLQNLMKSTSS
ncbi:hypothetical protein F6P94_10170 [Escherichia coli]|nr:hypothetical protein F6P94_10170 [Escherichia coli]